MVAAGRRCGVFTDGCALFLLAVLASTASATDRRSELRAQQGELKGRIETLSRDLAKSERSHADLRAELGQLEIAMAEAAQRLRMASLARQAVREELSSLERQRRQIEHVVRGQQEQLAQLLLRQQWHGETDAIKLLIAGLDPNHAARDLYYLQQLTQAKASLIGDLRRMAVEKKQLAEHERERHAKLLELEREEQRERAALQDKQRQRQRMLDALAERIRSQKREIETLKRDEKRLATLIETLARRKPAAPPSPVKQASRPVPTSSGAAVRPSNEPQGVSGAFAALKGKLLLPLKGEITARFGMARPEGGPSWKGVFIRAAAGSEVHAIAAGKVAFADFLRGYGNLLILDHGDDFLSVYANNESLLKNAGEVIRAGEVLATAGGGGSASESGLYFELRHRGQPFDPLRWARPR